VEERSAFARRDILDSLPVEVEPGRPEMFYRFDLEGVPGDMVANLAYLGTEKGRHAFRIQQDFASDSVWVYRILLEEALCRVENPRDIPEESLVFGKNPRHALMRDGECRVPDPILY
jgi:hypothetical protein